MQALLTADMCRARAGLLPYIVISDSGTSQALAARLERMRTRGSEAEAAEELEALRALLRCNVCHERQKDVVITKCWHLFCSHCIRRNVETRNRKCPGCGCPFGQQDVKQFFFT